MQFYSIVFTLNRRNKILRPIDVTLVASRLGGLRSILKIVSTFNSNSSLSFWSLSSWSCWSKETADEAVSSIAMGDEEAESAVADLRLDDWVECLVDWLYVAGLLCSSRLRSSWRNALKGNSCWKSGSNTFLDLRLGRAPAERDIATKKSVEKKKTWMIKSLRLVSPDLTKDETPDSAVDYKGHSITLLLVN